MPTSLTASEIEFMTVTLNDAGETIDYRTYRAQQYVEDLGDGLTLELVSIPGGSFVMGSPLGQGYPDEHPQHRVNVPPFLMGRYLITQAQWQLLMGRHVGRFRGATCPVENVPWQAVVHFCERLSRRTGRRYHLPSEAQWEYACRAGTNGPFAFGATLTTDVANYNGEYPYRAEPRGPYRHTPTQGGAFAPNAFGVFDMHGNLWEWCADVWHSSYEGAPTDGRAWSTSGETDYRVTRGGSWHDTPDVCRSAARLRVSAGEGDEMTGFRVALDAEPA
jgi:formylglycine-generating enzyme required for sulfatase activity